MKRKLTIGLGVLVLAALALPVLNLIIRPAVSTRLSDARPGDPLFAKAAAALQAKCSHCHEPGVDLPFYASFPVAKQIMAEDIAEGIEHFNFLVEYVPPAGSPVGETALAKTEHSIESGAMPPLRYLVLHWDGSLTSREKADVMTWTRDVRRRHYATPGFPVEVQDGVLQPLPAAVTLDAAKAALGNKLYHDPRLSKDDTISCASCHGLAMGGTDRKQFSLGVGGAVGDINSPTTYNAGFHFVQFWDGRAADLEEQADGPVNNPVEMASSWPEVIGKLEKDEALKKEFVAVYPDGYSSENIRNAIAEFERSLVTPDSRFDKFLVGDTEALSRDEREGHRLFMDRGCAACHVGKILGGQSYEKMGEHGDYFADRGGEVKKADLGRFNVTGKEADRHRFKVPTLRNVEQTAPYFHDGATTNLRDAVKIMARYQTDDGLTNQEAELVARFLRSLTGEYGGTLVQ